MAVALGVLKVLLLKKDLSWKEIEHVESPSGFSRDVVPVVTVLMTVIGYLSFTFSTVGLYNPFKTTSVMVCCERKPFTLINICKIK